MRHLSPQWHSNANWRLFCPSVQQLMKKKHIFMSAQRSWRLKQDSSSKPILLLYYKGIFLRRLMWPQILTDEPLKPGRCLSVFSLVSLVSLSDHMNQIAVWHVQEDAYCDAKSWWDFHTWTPNQNWIQDSLAGSQKLKKKWKHVHTSPSETFTLLRIFELKKTNTSV